MEEKVVDEVKEDVTPVVDKPKAQTKPKKSKKVDTEAFIERKLKSINERQDGARKEKSVARLLRNRGNK